MTADDIVEVAAGAVIALLVVGWSFIAKDRAVFARRVGWAALVIPLFLSTSKTGAEIQSSGVGIADALRAGVPLLALGIVLSVPARRRGFGWPEVFLLGFAAWLLFSSVWSIGARETFLKGAVQMVFYLLLLAMVRCYDTTADALRGVVAFGHFLLLSAVVSLAVLPGETLRTAFDGVMRLTGQLPPIHPNILGLVASVVLLALVVRFGPAWSLRPVVRYTLIAVYVAEAILARTRLALVVGVALVVFALVRILIRNALGMATVLIAAAGLLAVAAAQTATILEFFVRGQSLSELSTLTGRTVLWDRALDVWAAGNTWLGRGYYSGHRFGIKFVPGPVEQSTIDSVWVESLLDVGIIGMTLLALFALSSIVRIFRATRHGPFEMSLLARGIAVLAAASTFFSPSIQGTNLASIIFCSTFLAFAATAATADQKRREVPEPAAAARR